MMFRIPVRRAIHALMLTAFAVALVGLAPNDASADPHRKHRKHKHERCSSHRHESHRPRTVVVCAPPAPECDREVVVVRRDEPYRYRVDLGAVIGGVLVNVEIANDAPVQYGRVTVRR